MAIGKGLRRFTVIGVCLCVSMLAGRAFAQDFVAGTQPDRRPVDAPVISEFAKSAGWYDHALRGVVPPYPYSLRFLEDQGAWFTPFTRRGMTGPYDIRNMHERPGR